MHAGQRARLQGGELRDQPLRIRSVCEVIHLASEGLAGTEDVFAHERLLAEARLGEEVAAEQGFRRDIEEVATVPAVRQVRCRLPQQLVPAKGQLLPVGHRQWLDIGHVGDRYHGGDVAAHGSGFRRGGQELRETAALV
jgi:hypothetical protein